MDILMDLKEKGAMVEFLLLKNFSVHYKKELAKK
jgi:hypothetical protein